MKISVVIPVYNSERYLKKCLDSVINQTYSNWEVLAIDDGSIDTSYPILLGYAKKNSKIKVTSQKNRGPGLTRNVGILRTKGDYIVFLDSDDYLEKDYFENLVRNINISDADVIFIDVVQESTSGKMLKEEFASQYKNSAKETIIRHQMTGKLPWGGVRKVVKRSLIIDNNISYTDDDVGEEALYSLKVLLYSEKISFVDKICYHYINYPNSQSSKGAYDPWGAICRKIKKYLKEVGLYDNYESTINSFAYTALMVEIFRISYHHNVREAKEMSEEALKKFISEYSFELDMDSLESRVKCLIPFVKNRWILILVLVSKLKQRIY